MKIRNALYLAGTILIVASFVSLFKEAQLIWATLMVVVAIILLFFGYKKDKQGVKACLTKQASSKNITLTTVGIIGVFLGLGFAIGKLIYLWSH